MLVQSTVAAGHGNDAGLAQAGGLSPESTVPAVQDLYAVVEHILGAKNEPSVWLNHQTPSTHVRTCTGHRLVWEYLKRVESGNYT
jgi:hypothetical protein